MHRSAHMHIYIRGVQMGLLLVHHESVNACLFSGQYGSTVIRPSAEVSRVFAAKKAM